MHDATLISIIKLLQSSETAPPAPSLVGVEELPAPSSRDALFPKAIGLI